MEITHSPMELLFALIFVSAIWAYIARELIKVRRKQSIEVNQPDLPSFPAIKQLCQFLWLLGFYPSHREEITIAERPLLYRFLTIALYLVFISFSVAWLMVAYQFIEALLNG